MTAVRVGVAHYYPKHGHERSGVTNSIEAWVAAARQRGQSAVILGDSCGAGSDDSLGRRPIRHYGKRRATFVPKDLREHIRDVDLVYLHEGWTLSNVAAAHVCLSTGTPYVVMPHGVYEPGIMRSLKGPMRTRLRVEEWVLSRASAVHVFFPSEIDLITRIAPDAKVFAVPTGVDSAPGGWRAGGRYIAWFGRYEPNHKGLDILLRGLAQVPVEQRPQIVLRGYSFDGGKDKVTNLVSELGLHHWVEVGGEIHNEEKLDFLKGASAYVHPSRWESHSVALTEVLALGVPTVVSSTIHIANSLAQASATMTCGPTPSEWTRALQGAAIGNVGLGERGREFVATQLSWPHVLAELDKQLKHVRTGGTV